MAPNHNTSALALISTVANEPRRLDITASRGWAGEPLRLSQSPAVHLWRLWCRLPGNQCAPAAPAPVESFLVSRIATAASTSTTPITAKVSEKPITSAWRLTALPIATIA